MEFSLYTICIPALTRGLNVLSDYVDKAAAHAHENKTDGASLVGARLAPDMMTFGGQIQRASDTAKGLIGRLTALEVPTFADDETSLADLKERIAKTLRVVQAVRPEDMGDAAGRKVEFKPLGVTFRGDAFVFQFVLPNFYFHIATAHDVLRAQGLKIGKRDYLGPVG